MSSNGANLWHSLLDYKDLLDTKGVVELWIKLIFAILTELLESKSMLTQEHTNINLPKM